jgi:hypothetical protein
MELPHQSFFPALMVKLDFGGNDKIRMAGRVAGQGGAGPWPSRFLGARRTPGARGG